ncbi:2'-5' RNA ligase [Motilibacter peucedani]|uniref:2'-5' RNA ligase n=1 Tax=Motilibacter peucedani TaxID=598650 RepID=A0A420XRK3_9ACTN|nr:2'-5' RNA ligase family protein [Motilibacter peucedani]RKS77533.1 2'-5' RNA ligase [Motilibacter peucedani]
MSHAAEQAPIVVSARLDATAQEFFDTLRRRHFPADRLVVGAHLTLFHAIPGDALGEVLADLRDCVPSGPVTAPVRPPRSLGRGVAYDLDAPALVELHRRLRERWAPLLTRQDAQPLRPHVTVQNKVTPEQARRTLELLAAQERPAAAVSDGVEVWRYVGGPWEPVTTVEFG